MVPPQQRQAIEIIDSMMEVFAEVSLTEIAENVLDLPPEKRFTESIEEFAKAHGIENADSPDEENIPAEIQELSDENQSIRQMAALFEKISTGFRDRLLSIIVEQRGPPNPYLYALVLFDQLEDAMAELERHRLQEITDERSKVAVSRFVTLQAYLIKIYEGELTRFEPDHIRDLIRARYYGEKLRDREPEWDPETLSEEKVTSMTRAQGAKIVYEERAVSLSRGAELAGMYVSDYRSYLEERDIEVRYDVDSATEFENDPSL